MFASVTQFTVDFRGKDLDVAQAAFERNLVPELRKQNGYEGCYFLRTARGQGLMISLWEDEEALNTSEHANAVVGQMEEITPLLGKIAAKNIRFSVGFADHPVEPD